MTRTRQYGFAPSRRSAEHGFTPPRCSAEHGFTLVEMMVSLLIFALLAAAGVSLLAFSVRAQAGTDRKLADVAALNRLGSALSADLAQARDRQTRDTDGNQLPAFTGASGSGQTPMLRLVRAGWTNIDAAPRPSEQKVEYTLDDGKLQRIAYPLLDGAKADPASTMLDHVDKIALRYRFDGAWSDSWTSSPRRPLPQAVEMTLTRADGTSLRELFLVGTGYDASTQGSGNAG